METFASFVKGLIKNVVHMMEREMNGKIILLLSASSTLQRELVCCLLEKGATVILPLDSGHQIKLLKQFLPQKLPGTLITQLSDMQDYENVSELAESVIQKFGCIDLALALFNGGRKAVSLTDLPIDDWERMVDNYINAFFNCGRIFLQHIKTLKHGTYVSINQANWAGEHSICPLSKVATRMQEELSAIFAEEVKGSGGYYYHGYIKNYNDDHPGPEKAAHQVAFDISRQLISLLQDDVAWKEGKRIQFSVTPEKAMLAHNRRGI